LILDPDLFWWAYLLLGAAVGFVAGMLGAGGGLMMVPLLALIFEAKGFPPQYILHLALGTCMASIPFTSLASLLSHHYHGAVRWDIVRSLSPGVVAGALAGSIFAGLINTTLLSILFIAFVYYTSARMLLGRAFHAASSLHEFTTAHCSATLPLPLTSAAKKVLPINAYGSNLFHDLPSRFRLTMPTLSCHFDAVWGPTTCFELGKSLSFS